MGFQRMEKFINRTRPSSILQLVSIAVILVACRTIEPAPLYEPPYDAVSKHGLSAAAFSPNGHRAAVANFNTIWIFETASKNLRVSFSRHDRFGTNNTLVFLDDQRIATTAKSDPPGREGFLAAVKIWDINDPYKIPTVIELPELDSYAIALGHSPATGALAVGGQNGAVVLLEPTGSGTDSKRSLPGLSGPLLEFATHNDQTRLIDSHRIQRLQGLQQGTSSKLLTSLAPPGIKRKRNQDGGEDGLSSPCFDPRGGPDQASVALSAEPSILSATKRTLPSC